MTIYKRQLCDICVDLFEVGNLTVTPLQKCSGMAKCDNCKRKTPVRWYAVALKPKRQDRALAREA